MPAIKANPHYTVYTIEQILKNAGYRCAGIEFGRPQQGYKVWRQYAPGKEQRRKGGVLRVQSENHENQAARKAAERDYVEALRDAGVWVQVRGACIVIPQEEKYLPGAREQHVNGARTRKPKTQRGGN